MSSNLFSILSRVVTAPVDKVPSWLIGSIFGMHAFYAFMTEHEEDIEIVSKYKMVNYGSTQFMVVDSKGRHFNVNNSLWFWKWDSIENWASVGEKETRKVRYYGWRSPLLGLFPIIVGIR